MLKTITDLTIKDLETQVVLLGEPAYRAQQLATWVYKRLAVSYDEMSDLPQSLQQKLAEHFILHSFTLVKEVESSDGTVKALFHLGGGATVEAALMLYEPGEGRARTTVCVSTQVGCVVGCSFCATGQQGFVRNLTPGEIIDQVLYFARLVKNKEGSKERSNHITNIVFMGMGEPLANYEALMQAIETLNSPQGFGIGARSMTISTVGLVPQIKRLSEEPWQVGLAISLHATGDALRNRLVPANKRYPVKEVIAACKNFLEKTGRRVSFEYTLFAGINDSLVQARSLAHLLAGLNCHVNLIPANLTVGKEFRASPRKVILDFEQELKRLGINCTVRASRGQDIDAGCGQLRGRFLKQQGSWMALLKKPVLVEGRSDAL